MNSKIIKISEDVYRDKVMGCWLGKNAGGSLGMPHEMMWGNEKTYDNKVIPKLTLYYGNKEHRKAKTFEQVSSLDMKL